MSYADVLRMFGNFHRPAPRAFTGTQYRSAIFWHNEEQKEAALAWRRNNALTDGGAIDQSVAIEAARDFYKAEEYHQKYMAKASR